MRRVVPFVLALLLALQWGSAFAHCLRHAAPAHGTPAFSIEVCTSEGLVAMPWPGDPAPASAPAPMACPACAALAAIDPPEAPVLATQVVFTPVAFAVAGPRVLPTATADHPGRPRAPPSA